MQNNYSAYVTWRQGHDEFFVTRLDFAFDAPALEAARKWSNLDWVVQAAETEGEEFTPTIFELVSVMLVPFGTKVEFVA